MRNEEVDDINDDEIHPDDQELLAKDPINIVMLEDNQAPLKRPRNVDILRHVGLSEHAIREQLREKFKKKEDEDDEGSEFSSCDPNDIQRDIDIDVEGVQYELPNSNKKKKRKRVKFAKDDKNTDPENKNEHSDDEDEDTKKVLGIPFNLKNPVGDL